MRRLIGTAASTLVLATIPMACGAWGDAGHMMIAAIAWSRMNAVARAEAAHLLAAPGYAGNANLNFLDASYWADQVRRQPGFHWSAPLHFVDYPFSGDGSPTPRDLPAPHNIVTALPPLVAILSSHTTSDAEKAEALRFVIHFVGDIHQPLHCATRVTAAHPEGDRGGNDFWVAIPGYRGRVRHIRLHAWWDEGLGDFPPNGSHGAAPAASTIQSAAAAIVRQFPPAAGGWAAGGPYNYSAWAHESFDIARTEVYAGLVEEAPVPAGYAPASIAIARRRIAWAGYRLAALLNAIWPSHGTARSKTQSPAHRKAGRRA
ncbi:MAG: S1/P1 nuclease [Armatimonadetes bacterium]|nr:S1/P1 nuclease [Armatimonadota bacterium]MDE2206066.1 S1/P1 nuclease [Armatimonadota bacterium]